MSIKEFHYNEKDNSILVRTESGDHKYYITSMNFEDILKVSVQYLNQLQTLNLPLYINNGYLCSGEQEK